MREISALDGRVFEMSSDNERAVGCRIEFKFVNDGAKRDDDFPDIIVF